MTFERIGRLRVRSVTLKSTGQKVLIFNNDGPLDVLSVFMDDIGQIVKERAGDAVGYAVVVWGRTGGVSSSVRIRDGRYVGRSEVANFVKDVVDNHIFGYFPPEGA